MAHVDQDDDLDFENLRGYLLRLGFEQPAKVDNSIAFHHQESGTIIALSIPSDRRTVRSADLLSVMTRLESLGLVDDTDLQRLELGKLPMAS